MEKNISNNQIYKTSFYGRFGYIVMTIALSIFSPIFLGVGYQSLVHPDPWSEILVGIFFIVVGLGGIYLIITNLYYIVYFGKRFVLKDDYLEYYGFFKKIKIKWSDIKNIFVNYRQGAYVILYIESSHKTYKMDISGLKPTYSVLLKEIEKRRNDTFNVTINQNNPKEL